jgi:hypothetical protein
LSPESPKLQTDELHGKPLISRRLECHIKQ